MIQKIIKVGNSAMVTIPQAFLQQAGWKIGDDVVVEGDSQLQAILIKEESSPFSTRLTPEFKEWLDSFTKKNKKLLHELSK